MSKVKWIKLAADIFDNRKIKVIETMPEGDAILCIWLKLLCLAGTINDGGFIYITPEVPYTVETLTAYLGKPLSTVQLAFTVFRQYGMLEIIDDMLHISNWEKYQNTEALNANREQSKLRMRAYRERKKLAAGESNADVTPALRNCYADVTRQNKNKKEDIEEDNKKENKEKKLIFGEYANVKLTEKEYEKFCAECPESEKYINNLSEYMAMKKTSYINHLAVLRNWYRRDKDKATANATNKEKPKSAASYDIDLIEEQARNNNIEYHKRGNNGTDNKGKT